MLSKQQLHDCKKALVHRQQSLIQQAEDKNNRSLMLTEMSGELSSYDNHPADMGTALFDQGKDQALERHAEKELEQINEALHAIAEGTYGICSVCGEDIEFERLKAVPMTAHCKKHAEEERRHEMHVSDTRFEPHADMLDHAYKAFKEDGRPNAWSDVEAYGTSTTTHTEAEDEENSYDFL